jgi:two-component system NtrC family sensor kinase
MNNETLIYTEKELCKTCYTCVRGCPAKAIRIYQGQAEVIKERCINCGNCVLMCRRGAKKVKTDVEKAVELMKSGSKIAVCVAPSFPVEFGDIGTMRFVGMLRKVGFEYVCEVAFGADIVSLQYRRLVNENPDKKYISSACPAVVNYVRKYYPSLVKNLAPVVSPMIASSRVMKNFYGDDIKIIFVGPCIAKKMEIQNYTSSVEIALTFKEMKEIFNRFGVSDANSVDSYFDPPYPAKGVLYPIGRGLLNASEFEDDILSGRFMSASGLENFTEALKNIEKGDIKSQFIDLLCCDGCIMGPGISKDNSKYSREEMVRLYSKDKYFNMKINDWEKWITRFRDMDYYVEYTPEDLNESQPSKEEIKKMLEKMGKYRVEDELNCGACGYSSCVEHASAMIKGLAESEMCLPYTIEQLKLTANELKESYNQLSKTKQALVQSEKLASMGQLAASIAHELNNPLGIIMLYSKIMQEDIKPDNPIYNDVKVLVEQTERCKKIVSSLLNFARKNKPIFKKTDISLLIENYLKIFEKKDNIKIDFSGEGNVFSEVDSDQITQVLSNLVTNAVEAMPGGGTIKIRVYKDGKNSVFSISDTGCGIKEENMKKIFEPFFTTKQIGKGTGLGLAVSYGIIKAHKGSIEIKSNADPNKGPTGTEFIVRLPCLETAEKSVKTDVLKHI